ncbi:MAG: YARHG domain-containing protein [Candidatus Kapaibacterium sp.]
MKHFTLLVLVLLGSTYAALANDGAFYTKGNQLIPISETDITVQKEILTIKKTANKYIEVTVYYEFFNPGKEKKLTVGFEAFSPTGDVDGTPKNGQHPYIRNFTVMLNSKSQPFTIAYVEDSLYAKNGIVVSKKLKDIKASIENVNEVNFYYVYHFNATFKEGTNIIQHTYTYDVSSGVDLEYSFDYILTAANRWGNKQINDFTLNLDMGEFQTFAIAKSFFSNASEWQIQGVGKYDTQWNGSNEIGEVKFHIQKGMLVFRKMNFKPKGELQLYAQRLFAAEDIQYLPFSVYQQENIPEPKNEQERRILKNLPFARRGYVFTNPDLKKYYEHIDWYMPNPAYKPNTDQLTESEKKWIAKWK